MKLKVYLDTSVFSAYFDDRAPDRRAQTVEFWERISPLMHVRRNSREQSLKKRPILIAGSGFSDYWMTSRCTALLRR